MRILFVYKHKVSFVYNDIKLLSKHYSVNPFFFSGVSCIPKLYKAIREADLVFIWFASYHAFITTLLARIYHCPIVLVAGGYDVANEPEFNYGLARKRYTRFLAGYSLKRAARILSVSKFNQKEIRDNYGLDSTLVYNCADGERFKPDGTKKNIVITVGNVNSETWIKKGISKFVNVAEYFNSLDKLDKIDIDVPKFIVVGKISSDLKEITEEYNNCGSTLFFTGFLPMNQLIGLLQSSSVYCQFSRHESFGLSLAEAMLCECVPVAADRAALPEVIGNTGDLVSYHDLPGIVNSVKKALESNNGNEARERITTLFSPEIRESKLIEIVNEVGMLKKEDGVE